jgi:hypothetical protein
MGGVWIAGDREGYLGVRKVEPIPKFQNINWPLPDSAAIINRYKECYLFSRHILIVSILSLSLAVIYWQFHLHNYSNAFYIAVFLTAYAFYLPFNLYIKNKALFEIILKGNRLPAVIIRGVPENRALRNTEIIEVAIKEADLMILPVKLTINHCNFPLFSRRKRNFAPKENDTLIVYYLDKHPYICHPVANQLFKPQ